MIDDRPEIRHPRVSEERLEGVDPLGSRAGVPSVTGGRAWTARQPLGPQYGLPRRLSDGLPEFGLSASRRSG